MRCPNCKAKLDDFYFFCPECGTKIPNAEKANADCSNVSSYETDSSEEEGSVALGFIIGFFGGTIGLILGLILGKEQTKKGTLIGFIVSFIIGMLSILVFFALMFLIFRRSYY